MVMADYPRPPLGVMEGESWAVTCIHWKYRLSDLKRALEDRGGTLSIRESFTPECDYYLYLIMGEAIARNQHVRDEPPMSLIPR